ncbi:right-handed parallel beta-helix repeat-containing protein [Amycolatopsis sp. PS_44_ISF1]|uniref:right-handed parallel beta-helix repeat-containing protein n=1 Tax=Amycolatopsis sp. PS_44_ISF1 TaxID=2974917 RepID=UPI0037BE99A5
MTSRLALLLGALGPLVLAGCSGPPAPDPASSQVAETSKAPSGPVAAVCDRMPPGPATAPAGAVSVDPAVPDDLATKTKDAPAGTTFWLGPGSHHLGDDRFDQVRPKDGDVYLGAPGAVLDGRRLNQYAFTGPAKGVKIESLTVQGFVAPRDEGVVNHDSGDGWVIRHSTVQDNDGAGLMAGAKQQVLDSCLRRNGQYGMNAFSGQGDLAGLVVRGNEITGNNTGDWEAKVDGCGCTGGIKFWAVDGADVTGNWVHDNRGTGLWADTDDNDFLIEGNLIEGNDSSAITYETSYNAVIRNNTLRRNNLVDGHKYADRGDTFPVATVYVSESGGEPRVRARTSKLEIYGNVFEDNWNGITLWENADRFCNSPANTSSGVCTKLVPDVAKCAAPAIAQKPLYDDCRWKTQRVDVHNNRFVLDPAAIGCQETCARMGLLSNFGTYPDWSPYRGDAVQNAITHGQGNTWHDNAYIGPWTFIAVDQSHILGIGEWEGAPYDQDARTTYQRGGGG